MVVTIDYRLGLFGWFTHPELAAESDVGERIGHMTELAERSGTG